MSFAAVRARWIMRQPMEGETLQRITGFVRSGAMTFMKKEYGALVPFVLVVAGFLYVGNSGFLQLQAFSFLIGATASGLAGYIGMYVATAANGRTTHAALSGMDPVRMLVLTRLNFLEFGAMVTDPAILRNLPALFYTQLELDAEQFLQDFEVNPVMPPTHQIEEENYKFWRAM